MPPTPIQILPVVDEAEIPTLATLAVLALSTDPFYDFFEKYSGKIFYDDVVTRLTAALKETNTRVFKAVKPMMRHDKALGEGQGDGGGRERGGEEIGASVVVGVSQWYVGYCEVPKVDPFAFSKGDGDERKGPRMGGQVPGGSFLAATTTKTTLDTLAEQSSAAMVINLFNDHVRRSRNVYISTIRGKKHVYLRRFFVHPDHQRQGIGRMLLQWGMDVADEGKLVTWLLGRPAGTRLYEKNGWKNVATLEIEAEGIDVPPTMAMLRQPRMKYRGGGG